MISVLRAMIRSRCTHAEVRERVVQLAGAERDVVAQAPAR